MKKNGTSNRALEAAHIKFANILHDVYKGIGYTVRPIKLMAGIRSRRETLLKQIKRLQDKMDTQWYRDCPSLAGGFNSIYLNDEDAAKAAHSSVGE